MFTPIPRFRTVAKALLAFVHQEGDATQQMVKKFEAERGKLDQKLVEVSALRGSGWRCSRSTQPARSEAGELLRDIEADVAFWLTSQMAMAR